MPGWVRLRFEREPDYFHGLGIQGRTNQAMVALEGERLIGTGCRSIRPMYIDGRALDFGYLSGLRSLPAGRQAGALARGYRFLRERHGDRRVPAYISTIVADNATAIGLLTSGRAGLPHYLDQGRYFTYAVSLNRRRRPPGGQELRRGGDVPLADIVAFLNRQGARRQFFPVLTAGDFGTDYLRGLSPADFRVAIGRQGQAIEGVVALWDQSRFKQNVVAGYAGPVRLLRPAINGLLGLAGHRPLPPVGQRLDMLYAAFLCVRDDNLETAQTLLEQVYAERRAGPHAFLVLGFHERDPLRAALRGFPAFRYTSRLYLVCWEDGLEFVSGLDPARIPHLEVATL